MLSKSSYVLIIFLLRNGEEYSYKFIANLHFKSTLYFDSHGLRHILLILQFSFGMFLVVVYNINEIQLNSHLVLMCSVLHVLRST